MPQSGLASPHDGPRGTRAGEATGGRWCVGTWSLLGDGRPPRWKRERQARAVGTRLLAVRQQGLDTAVTLLLASSEAGPDAFEAIADLAGQVIAQRTTSVEEDYLALLSAA